MRRFGTRLPVRLEVEAQIGRALHSLYTWDVGLDGLFITSTQPPGRHHLVHVAVVLPGEADRVRLRGVVVRTINPMQAVAGGLPRRMSVSL